MSYTLYEASGRIMIAQLLRRYIQWVLQQGITLLDVNHQLRRLETLR